MNLNKVFLIGRLTADPELRQTTSGQSVATFSIATNRVWNNKEGQKQEEVQFHNIVVWARQAETASQYLKKGQMVLVEGRIQNRSYEAKDGTKRYVTEIVAENLQFGPKAGGGGDSSGGNFTPKKKTDDKKEEEIPTITIDEEIKPEDLDF